MKDTAPARYFSSFIHLSAVVESPINPTPWHLIECGSSMTKKSFFFIDGSHTVHGRPCKFMHVHVYFFDVSIRITPYRFLFTFHKFASNSLRLLTHLPSAIIPFYSFTSLSCTQLLSSLFLALNLSSSFVPLRAPRSEYLSDTRECDQDSRSGTSQILPNIGPKVRIKTIF